MAFEWARAIEKNRDELIGIVTTLFVLAGIRTGVAVETLPHALYLRILGVLRPAEAAARRLILMAACTLVVVTVRRAETRGVRPVRAVGSAPVPKAPDPKAADAAPVRTAPDAAGTGRMEACATSLVMQGGRPSEAAGPRINPGDDDRGAAARDAAERARGGAFMLFDPLKRRRHPWLEPGDFAEPWLDDEPAFYPWEPIGAAGLCGRIRALERALEDLQGHALRLARWRARRDRGVCRPRRWRVMRPGRPPGLPKRPKKPVERVLRECQVLALDAWNTS